MSDCLIHPITAQSFAIIDREIGEHSFTAPEYAIVRRIIHTTADFEFKQLTRFTDGAIAFALEAIAHRTPIVVDVGMVKQGIVGLLIKTFGNEVITALDFSSEQADRGDRTRSELGMRQCMQAYPEAIFAIGNAPTALLALCQPTDFIFTPKLIIGAPVGFVSVLESKAALARSPHPHIRVEGRKGGSPVAAAIVNALVTLAWERRS
ncbi:precorrin-8X methylmutase [Pseudanabaena sp. PCC 6802]|uniref:precorrin-8X methylmutase n=1 Tax=Pseudanabaena sp. PCC 6802 TaxID=118173 RepID=UPI000368F4A3|nr:precorrin-8X methylmutase [Pseudanabaena sp. PCC 6802]